MLSPKRGRGDVCILLLLCVMVVNVWSATPPAPTSLQCGYLERPIGVDRPNPRLSWKLSHSDRGQAQSAFQVQVSTSSNFEASSIVWDTNKRTSTKTYAVYGSGTSSRNLASDTSYWWRVMWWDSNGAGSPWTVSNFDTGLFAQNDWVGKWVGGSKNLLRKVFALQGAPKRARAFISGLGYYELYVNGQRVGENILDPGWTTYNKRVLYNVYDVTSLLVNGNNAVGVMLGHGWYSSSETREPNGPLSLIFQISVDGKIYASSDESWSTAQGPITSNGIYNGETYDARLEQDGWDTATFNMNNAWSATQTVTNPGGVLSYQMINPVQVDKTVKPLKITNTTNGKYIFDFGQNFSGFCKLSITGPAGTTVTLRFAEILDHSGDGQIYTDNLRSAKATDTYILKGDKNGENYTPHFTYHGFRYVEFSASPAIVPSLSNLLGIHFHSLVPETGSISMSTSSGILNKIQSNIIWGQRSNLMSVPTDCDQRDERKGWMGDAQLSGEEAIHNFYMPSFYTHFLTLIRDEQGSDGTLTDTVPLTFGDRPADPAWGSAYPSLLYWVWKYYDDIELVQNHYSNIKKYIDYLTSRVKSSGIGQMFYSYGDWVPPPPQEKCSEHLTSAFSYLANLRQFIEMAQALNNQQDVSTYNQLLTTYTTEFNSAFLDTSKNLYNNGVQTCMTLPLWLNIQPASNKASIVNNFLNDISKHDTHLTTGIIGTKYIMETLHWMDRDDIALQIAENLDYPSWGYMITNPIEPATAVWELWDAPSEGPGMNSRSHIMFGTVSDWFYKALAGIDFGESYYFDKFEIAPYIGGDLTGVEANFITGQGNISVEWSVVGRQTVCASAAEGHTLHIDCSGVGSESVIEKVDFASFGLPFGQCGHYSAHDECDAHGVVDVVRERCLGKRGCELVASHTALGVEKPCTDFSRMYTQVTCSKPDAAYGYNLNVKVPVGASAKVVFPKIDISNEVITETVVNQAVWQNGKFTAITGISSVTNGGDKVVAVVGSGSYQFSYSGVKGETVCVSAPEQVTAHLACEDPNQSIRYIKFASFGLPYGQCGDMHYGTCNAGSTLTVVRDLCLNKKSCDIRVDPALFGDPCFQTAKNLAVEAVCSN